MAFFLIETPSPFRDADDASAVAQHGVAAPIATVTTVRGNAPPPAALELPARPAITIGLAGRAIRATSPA